MSKDVNEMMNKVLSKVNELSKQASNMVQKGADSVKDTVKSVKNTADLRDAFKHQILPQLRDQLVSMDEYQKAAVVDELMQVNNTDLRKVDDDLMVTFGSNDSHQVAIGFETLLKAVVIADNESQMNNFRASALDVLMIFHVMTDTNLEVEVSKIKLTDDENDTSLNQDLAKNELDKDNIDGATETDQNQVNDDGNFASLAGSLEDEFKGAIKKAMEDPTFTSLVASLSQNDDQKKED